MKINLTPQKLMDQAVETAKHYMFEAQKAIDARFGKGYAESHPELMAAFMKTAALDFGTSIIDRELQEIDESILSLRRED